MAQEREESPACALASRLLKKGRVIRRNSVVPVSMASWLVRYRFDSAQSLVQHLNLAEGFFVPARPAPASEGEPVIVEIDLPEGTPRFLHGRVGKRFRGGVWLDMPAARSMARRALAMPTRLHRRFACDLFVEVAQRGADPWMLRVVDLSAGGLRVAAGGMDFGVTGDEVEATLLAPEVIAAVRSRIAWAGNRSAGLEIIDADHAFADLLFAVEASWHAADEISHDGSCVCVESVLRAG
jgi:hypothetical protein